MFNALLLFCVVSFLGYGAGCIWAKHMAGEFTRYRLPQFRLLTGVLQILGAVGLLAGLRMPLMGTLAAGGLAVLMLLGLAVRMRIRDGFLRSLPAFLYMVVSAWLCHQFAGRMIM